MQQIDERAHGGQAPSRKSAVLDGEHPDEIRGALGTVRAPERGVRRTWRQRLLALLAIMGPGLIVMVGDNDAGGVSTYAQAGQNNGTSLLWTLILLIPVLIVNQEMVVRLGAVTGVGHARLIFERFGKFWGYFSVVDLFALNFLTIVTEFIGISLGAEYFGLSPYIAVPVAAVLLVMIAVTGSFERWERAMFLFIIANLLIIPLVIIVHAPISQSLHDTFVPGIKGGITSTSILLIIAIVGTTVAPWQLFFQQSNVIDKRITPRWIPYERADTVIGAFVVVLGAGAIMIAAAGAFEGTPLAGQFVDAGGVARGIARYASSTGGALFAIVLIDASIIGASAVTLATSYAFGDVFGLRHSLHRSWREAKPFYASYAGLVFVAAGIVLIPSAPLGLITTAVQALAGILLPSASLFLLLLCNDPAVLGPWVNRPWLNALASLILGVLLVLSLILVTTTIFPSINVGLLFIALTALLVAGLAALAFFVRSGSESAAPIDRSERDTWRMPPIALLTRPPASRARTVALTALFSYLAIAVLLLLVKAVQLATGH
ncbi:MAG: divalent metal cation transporter [Candidatus Dormibacteraeota bacterium]|nr:divalent metal cation transporter [Candidatus Dormibacteraeota bacterium]